MRTAFFVAGPFLTGSHFGWRVMVYAAAMLAVMPLAAIAVLAFTAGGNSWPHLLATVLPDAVADTLILMLGVAICTLVAGTLPAWLVTMYRFPGRGLFGWALILPLAMPAYITAYCYGEFLDYTGPLQTLIRSVTGAQNARDYWFPEWRSTGGAVFVLSSVLYPYVYLMARASFQQQPVCILDTARTLGRTAGGAFLSVALPMARPALAAGVALVMMECLNDIGAVEFLGVRTVTVTIYATWVQRSDLGGAAQIALVMIAFVLALTAMERAVRTRQRYHNTARRERPSPGEQLTGAKAWLAALACALPLLCGFVIPVVVLIDAVFIYSQQAAGLAFWQSAWNSMLLACLAAAVTVALAWLVRLGARIVRSRGTDHAARISGLGYAIPGTVVAVGTLIPFAAFDNTLDAWMREQFGLSTGLLLSGSLFALVFAYTVRFLAVALGAIDAGYAKLSPNLDAAARTLGASAPRMLRDIHWPLLRAPAAAAALLVFVDSMKELPATLLLRPFNFETLSTQVYIFASLEQFERSAPAALTIVAIGLLPIILLNRALQAPRY